MAEILCFISSHFDALKRREYFFERYHMCPCNFLGNHRMLKRPHTHPRPTERREVRTETDRGAEVMRK